MMEAMTEDYVRTARAKGASTTRVLFRHALRNAIIPIITLLGLSIPAIVSGALITETCSTTPAWGSSTYQAATNTDVAAPARDHPGGHVRHRHRVTRGRHPLRRRRSPDPLCPPVRALRAGGALRRRRPSTSRRTAPAPSRGSSSRPMSVAPPKGATPRAAVVPCARSARVFIENKLAVVGLVLIILMVAVLLAGPALLPHQPDQRPGGPAQHDLQRASGREPPPRHRRRRVRHPRPPHVRREELAARGAGCRPARHGVGSHLRRGVRILRAAGSTP